MRIDRPPLPGPVPDLAAGPDRAEAELRAAAEQFEALFLENLMKSARASGLSDGLLNNEGSRTFQSLLDREHAGFVAQGASFGIADALVGQFRGIVAAGRDET